MKTHLCIDCNKVELTGKRKYCDECGKMRIKESIQKHHQKIKRTRHCKLCGKEIGKGKQYCDECRESHRIRHCKMCGKEIEKGKQYCDECRKIRRKENSRKYRQRPELKEKLKTYSEEYRNRPGAKERFLKYREKYKTEHPRKCTICGKEPERRKRYCDECRIMRQKETWKKYYKKWYDRMKKNKAAEANP
jgi:predicted nucleic acid-binding Zn ribbon protein